MSPTLLFIAGSAVFAVTVCAVLLYGFFTLERIAQAEQTMEIVFADTATSPASGIAPLLLPAPALIPE